MYFVYILKSLHFPKTYVGITDNPERRLKQHNLGYHFYTKRYIPWTQIYTEEVTSRNAARDREKYLKSSAGRRWMKRVIFS